MNRFYIGNRWIFPLLLLGLCSCAAEYKVSPGQSLELNHPHGGEMDMKSPFMIREASLPKGFPAPGPVGEVILKQYPAYRAARATAPSGNQDAADSMFRRLFRHIKDNSIAMSAPVEMTYASDAASYDAKPAAMAFIYGDPQLGQPAERGDVEVVDLPAQTVLSVAVRGGYDKAFVKGQKQLGDWLSENPGRYEVTGPPRFLGYNSPFVPWFLRIGEAQLPVKPVVGATGATR